MLELYRWLGAVEVTGVCVCVCERERMCVSVCERGVGVCVTDRDAQSLGHRWVP